MRPLSAPEICRIWELGQGQHPIDRALTLLTLACPGVGWDELAEFSIGERDARLLTLHEQNFGPALDGSADCPRCAEPLEFTISTAVIRVADPDVPVEEEHTLEEGGFELRFRLPNSRDLAAVAVCEDVDAARRRLVERCVLEASHDGEAVPPSELTPKILTALAARMAECDPQAEVLLNLRCPTCDHRWQVLFDIGAFLWTELAAWVHRLLREVHSLAQAYGWREADILAMSAARRRFYIELVTR